MACKPAYNTGTTWNYPKGWSSSARWLKLEISQAIASNMAPPMRDFPMVMYTMTPDAPPDARKTSCGVQGGALFKKDLPMVGSPRLCSWQEDTSVLPVSNSSWRLHLCYIKKSLIYWADSQPTEISSPAKKPWWVALWWNPLEIALRKAWLLSYFSNVPRFSMIWCLKMGIPLSCSSLTWAN